VVLIRLDTLSQKDFPPNLSNKDGKGGILVITIETIEHYLVNIEEREPMGNMGQKTILWYWEFKVVKIGDNAYKMAATESNNRGKIPWFQIMTKDPIKTMKERCLRYMGIKEIEDYV
jgi:hypothetical protein